MLQMTSYKPLLIFYPLQLQLQLVERLASDDIFRARKLSTSSRQDRSQQLYKKPAVDEVPEIPKPIEIEIDEKPDRPIRVVCTHFTLLHRLLPFC